MDLNHRPEGYEPSEHSWLLYLAACLSRTSYNLKRLRIRRAGYYILDNINIYKEVTPYPNIGKCILPSGHVFRGFERSQAVHGQQQSVRKTGGRILYYAYWKSYCFQDISFNRNPRKGRLHCLQRWRFAEGIIKCARKTKDTQIRGTQGLR